MEVVDMDFEFPATSYQLPVASCQLPVASLSSSFSVWIAAISLPWGIESATSKLEAGNWKLETDLCMYRCSMRGVRGLAYGLGHRRVRVDRPDQLFDGTLQA
jgi:hypothetical protein